MRELAALALRVHIPPGRHHAEGQRVANQPRPLDAAALRAWVADPANGLVQEVRPAPHTVTCRYRPTDLLVAQDLANAQQGLTARAVDSVRRQYAGKAYFALELAGPGGGAQRLASPVRDEITGLAVAVSSVAYTLHHTYWSAATVSPFRSRPSYCVTSASSRP